MNRAVSALLGATNLDRFKAQKFKLDRLHINGSSWLDAVEHFNEWFGHIAASAAAIAEKAARIGSRWLHGLSAATQTFQ